MYHTTGFIYFKLGQFYGRQPSSLSLSFSLPKPNPSKRKKKKNIFLVLLFHLTSFWQKMLINSCTRFDWKIINRFSFGIGDTC